RERLLGPNHRDVGATRAGLSGAYAEQGDVLSAAREAHLGGQILLAQEGTGKLAEAIDLFLKAITAINLTRNYDQAERQLRECAALVRAQLGNDHMYLAFVLSLLADVQEARGHHDEAERTYRECLDLIRRQIGLTHPRTHVPLSHLAHLLRQQGRGDEAEE